MKLRGTRVQYGFLLHRNCFLLINMLENFIKFENFQKYFKIIKLKKKNLKFKNTKQWSAKYLKLLTLFRRFFPDAEINNLLHRDKYIA
jgi:hypothetical protein